MEQEAINWLKRNFMKVTDESIQGYIMMNAIKQHVIENNALSKLKK